MAVIQHPVETLRSALISSHHDLVKSYNRYSQEERMLLEEGLRPGGEMALFQPITVLSDSDWIPSHPEEPQDFQSFYRNLYRNTPIQGYSTIYIQTIGSFGEAEGQYVEWLREYCQAFFYGLVVKLLPSVTVAATGCAFRVNSSTHNLQIHAGDLLHFLKKRKPKDSFCVLGITMIDLYPRDSWNFVFGQASVTKGIGVFSFARYDHDFYSSSYAGRVKRGCRPKHGDYSVFKDYYTPPISSMLLLRSCKTVSHELGHVFGIKHCKWMECVMQGSNHLEESDRRPLHLCPICLRKLQAAIGFNMADRYKALLLWIEEEGGVQSTSFKLEPALTKPNQTATQPGAQVPRPTQAFNSFRLWLRRCLDILEAGIL